MEEGKNMRITTPDGARSGSGLKRFTVTILIILAILYVGAFFGLRTDGARSLVEGALEKRLGMDVKIGETSMAFPLGISMATVAAGDMAGGQGGLIADEIAVRFLASPGIRVSAKGLELALVQDSDGSWQPRFFATMSDLPQAGTAGISEITKGLSSDFSLRVKGSLVKWVDADGSVLAMAEGTDFEMQPVKLPGRKMVYYRLGVFKYTSEQAPGGGGRDILREWLYSPDAGLVDVVSKGDLPVGSAAAAAGVVTETADESQ
jgi:hypothetical protein